MKARKFFGVLFTILGAMAIFLSLAVLILPLVANDQTRLVLDSFYQPSDHVLVNAINSVMSFMLENSFLTLALGAGLLLTGILFLLSATRYEEEQASKRRSAQRAAAVPAKQPPVWKSQKATEIHQTNPFAAPAAAAIATPVTSKTEASDENKPEAVFTEPVTLSDEKLQSPLAVTPSQETTDPTPYQRPAEPAEETTSQPDDRVYSFGTARRISSDAEPVRNQPESKPETPSITPLFSTTFHSPATKIERETSSAEPAPLPVEIPVPAPDNPRKVIIKSTMGKHTL